MKRIEDMTRLDLITVALCFGGRPFSYGQTFRAIASELRTSQPPEGQAYTDAMLQLGRAEAISLVEMARTIEAELDKP